MSGSLSQPDPLNEAAVEVRTRVQAVLASWARLVIGERGLATRLGDVGHLARFLALHLDWLAAGTAAASLVVEIDALVAGALGVIDTGFAVRRIEIGACVEPGCGGTLAARVQVRGEGPPEVACDAGRHVWSPHQWLLLQRCVEETRRA